MKYHQVITLKDGRLCVLRNGTQKDGQGALDNFILTHQQTDQLLSYADEIKMTAESEGCYLKEREDSRDSVELLAIIDDQVVGMAGISPVGSYDKLKHRAEFGVSIDENYWGLGIGRALTQACIDCAKQAGYKQLELDVVATNQRAIALYQSEGFVIYGRNPHGFQSRYNGYQELVLMYKLLR